MIATNLSKDRVKDLELQRRVTSYLHSKRMRSLNHIDVEASRGTVVLRGEVGSFYEKQLCLNCTRRVAGVVDLIDEILVREMVTASRP